MVDKPPINSADTTTSSPGGAETDPLLHLHHMSTTAGVSEQEYVAISGPAIVGLLLSLVGILAALDPVLLVIPITALCFAWVSLLQIKHSNGTQTGKKFALTGLVLALGVIIYVAVSAVRERFRNTADGQAIDVVLVHFGQDLVDRNYDHAYTLFSDGFRARYTPKDFVATLQSPANFWVTEITGFGWNGRANFQTNSDTGVTTALVGIKVFLRGNQQDRMEATMRKTEQGWKFDNVQFLFPSKKPTPNQPGPR